MIETKKHPITGKSYSVYVIYVERESSENESPAVEELFLPKTIRMRGENFEDINLPNVWTIAHRPEEFYLLEARIRALCNACLTFADLADLKLPEKKAFSHAQSRSFFMEAHRVAFEKFLLSLSRRAELRRSDLLYNFLTTSEEDSCCGETGEEFPEAAVEFGIEDALETRTDNTSMF